MAFDSPIIIYDYTGKNNIDFSDNISVSIEIKRVEDHFINIAKVSTEDTERQRELIIVNMKDTLFDLVEKL